MQIEDMKLVECVLNDNRTEQIIQIIGRQRRKKQQQQQQRTIEIEQGRYFLKKREKNIQLESLRNRIVYMKKAESNR